MSEAPIEIIGSHLARLLKEEREKRGISLNGLSQKSGVSRQAISYIEQQVQSPTFETLLRISTALETDIEKLIAQARKRAQPKQSGS